MATTQSKSKSKSTKSKSGKPKRPKLDREAVEELVEALGKPTEIERVHGVHAVLAGRADRVELATAALAEQRDGAEGRPARGWLATIAGTGTDDDARAIAEHAAVATAGRVAAAAALGEVADRVDDVLLARALAQLEEAVPFAAVQLADRSRAAVRANDPAYAARLDARAEFAARHASLLAALREDAKEKDRNAAIASLPRLTGDDRMHAATWVISEAHPRSDALPWARLVAIVEPRIPAVLGASALVNGYVGDDDEKELGKEIADAGDPGRDHALAILDEGVDRGWGGVIEHLAPARPELFATPRGFQAVLRGFAAGGASTYRLCEDARYWIRALDAAQAAKIAEILVPLCEAAEDSGHFLHYSVGRAFFYFENPGGLATFAAALARDDSSEHLRDELYDAIENIPGRAAEDVLIGQLWKETRNTRDLVFAFNKSCMPHRHADVLARLDAVPSLHAAWLYGACQMHWAHRPRLLVDIVERVLAWGDTSAPDKYANLLSDGVRCALELRRYDLASRCLELLGDTRECLEPTNKKPTKTVLADKEMAKQLADLRSGKLAAAQARAADEIAALRAAGTPRGADDDRLGLLAGGTVGHRLHTDTKSREVWFLDAEGELFYYDGYGIADPPFTPSRYVLEQGWDVEVPGLAAFCTDWHTDGRSLHTSKDGRREVVRSGARLVLQLRAQNLHYTVFGFELADADAAAATFEALDAHPLVGFKPVDPFYVPGKRGGTWIREWGNDTEIGYVVGREHAWGESKWKAQRVAHASHDEAIAAFEERAAGCLARGLFPREVALDDGIRPLDDTPLYKWLDDRKRDDEQPAGWHVRGLPEMMAALALSEIPLDDIEVELGPPATDGELAAYDAALPEPMPPEMREMWTAASTARWRVGDHVERLLSPTEVLRDRDAHRARIADMIAAHKKRKRIALDPQMLDVFVLRDDAPWLAFDVRQQHEDGVSKLSESYMLVSPSGLVWSLAEGFCSDFVDALVEKFPAIKKLTYGQRVADLVDKAKAKAKSPKSKAKKKR